MVPPNEILSYDPNTCINPGTIRARTNKPYIKDNTMNNQDKERMHALMDIIDTLNSAERKELDRLQNEYIEHEQLSFGQNLACFIND